MWKLLVLQRPDILETIFKVRLKGVGMYIDNERQSWKVYVDFCK